MDLRQWNENPVKGEQKKKLELKADQIKKAAEIYRGYTTIRNFMESKQA